MIFAVLVLNKAGQLIYQKNWTSFGLPLTLDDFLQMAGVFHAMYLLSAAVSPTKESTGFSLIESDRMVIRCLQVHTGTKFLVTADPTQPYLEELLNDIYELYIDYALKNPFYDIEQPIHSVCEKFVSNLEAMIQTIQKGGAPRSVTALQEASSSTTTT